MSPAQPSNDNRPAEFDRLIVKYLPGLNMLAVKMDKAIRRNDRRDLVQDTLCYALDNWRSYRDGTNIFTWLSFVMRHLKYRQKHKPRVVTSPFNIPDDSFIHPRYEAPQPAVVDLKRALGALTAPERTVATVIAVGGTLEEAGREIGVTKQRAAQILDRGRQRLSSIAVLADTRRALVG